MNIEIVLCKSLFFFRNYYNLDIENFMHFFLCLPTLKFRKLHTTFFFNLQTLKFRN